MYYTIKVQIRGITKPPVWRRLEVPGDDTLYDLHYAIQDAFGWTNDHLYAFADKTGRAWRTDPPETPFDAPNPDITVEEYFHIVGGKGLYVYDFGDRWEHLITVEKAENGEIKRCSCLAGKGACPPEDCGGSWRYEYIKKLMAGNDPEDEEDRKSWMEWLGIESPAEFDPNACKYPPR